MGADAGRHLCENTDDFLTLLSFQFPDLVVGLHYLRRLYKHRTARGTLVMYYAWNTTLQRRNDRYHQSPVAQRWSYVFLH